VNITERGGIMSVSYKKLLHLMIERELSSSQLQKLAKISGNVFTRIRRNEYVSLESIEAICGVLHCGVDDIIDFLPDEKENKSYEQ
jgi:putative transcriptional regulator